MARTSKSNMSEETMNPETQTAMQGGNPSAQAGGSAYPPAPQAAAEGMMQQNPLEGLPPAAQQHIMILTQYVGQIIQALQEFIPAITQRLAEIEAQLGGETSSAGMNAPTTMESPEPPSV